MPTYDYRCTECGREFSVEQRMTDKPLKRCRECGGRLEKLLPKSINLIFKGSGFYCTDYKKQEPKHKHSDSAKSDTKPDIKPDAKRKETKKDKEA